MFSLFSNMNKKVDKNIKKKEYVRTMRSDFGTSTSEHQIATNIAIMSSVQVTNKNTKYKYKYTI